MLEKFRTRSRSYTNPKPVAAPVIESEPVAVSADQAVEQAASLVKSLVSLRKFTPEQGKRITRWVQLGKLNLETVRSCLILSTLELQKQVGKWDQELD